MDVIERLRAAGERLDALSDREVLDGLDAALARWRKPRGPAARAARGVAARRGLSAAMVRFGLERMAAAHDRAALARWLAAAQAEAGVDPAHARGPRVVVQVLAGNVAGLAVPAAVEALLARSAVLLKPAAEEPITAALFRESLSEAAPDLAEAVAIRTWKGGDAEVEREVFRDADFVVATGGREMADALSLRLERPHLIYGPKISIGLVGRGWRGAPEAWWREVAREIVLWDQQGCLSPRVLFVAGELRHFAARLAGAMRFWERTWPARPRTPAEAAAVHGFRARYEMADGRSAGLIAPRTTAWTVVWDEEPSLRLGPASRTVRVAGRPTMRRLSEILLAAHAIPVQGMGTAFLGSQERRWREAALRGGVPHVASLTAIQDPPAGWRADGRSGLAELLRRGRREPPEEAGAGSGPDPAVRDQNS